MPCSLIAFWYISLGLTAIPLLNSSLATNALTLFLQWFQVLHMLGSHRQCKGVHPAQLLNQSLPALGFCCHLHAHIPTGKKWLKWNSIKNDCNDTSMIWTARHQNFSVCDWMWITLVLKCHNPTSINYSSSKPYVKCCVIPEPFK